MAKKKKEKYVLSSEDLRKMERAARRKVRLEKGEYTGNAGFHKGTKKDYEEESTGTLSRQELEDLLDEEDLESLEEMC